PGAAILFANDDILRYVDETTGQVTRVRRAEGGISETLTGTVGRDEVLGDRQALTVRVDNRTRNDLTLWITHQTAHTRDVADLQPVTTCTRGHHAVDGVVSRERGAHGSGHLVGRFGPDLDKRTVTLGIGDEALVELLLHRGRGLLVLG